MKFTCHNAAGDSAEVKTQKFRGWEGTDTFTMSVVPFSPYPNPSSAGSEYLGSSSLQSAQKTRRERDPPNSASWAVVNMITTHVAVLLCDGQQYVGKWFGVRPDWSAEKHEGIKLDAEVNIDNELVVYTVCHALQGAGIPHCYGVGEILGVTGRVLVLEHIPGPTVAQLVGGGLDCVPGRKKGLVNAAGDVLRALHKRGVVHLDLHPWNMVVFAGETVVVVDFDMSMVCTDEKGVREWEDWVLLKAAFEA